VLTKSTPEALTVEQLLFQGQPCLKLQHACGDHVLVALHGAHVLSWVSAGQEQLYLSPKSTFDGHSAIRGGVPICFPQFNQRGPLPKHGFARNLRWHPYLHPYQQQQTHQLAYLEDEWTCLSLRIETSPETRSYWDQAFELILTVQLQPSTLQLKLSLRNAGTTALTFTGALHTYLRVDDIGATRLLGLEGQPVWDAVRDCHEYGPSTLYFEGEFDRVFEASAKPLQLLDGERRLQIEQSQSLAHTVVWNPGSVRCASLPDMTADGWKQMLCVEAAQVLTSIALAGGQTWQGWQRLRVL